MVGAQQPFLVRFDASAAQVLAAPDPQVLRGEHLGEQQGLDPIFRVVDTGFHGVLPWSGSWVPSGVENVLVGGRRDLKRAFSSSVRAG